MLLIITLSFVQVPFIQKTDPEFTPYIQEFEKYYNNKVKTPIIFGNDFEKSTIGVCITYNKHIKIIQINPRFWNVANQYEKEALIFHELGHCELDKDHNDGFYQFKEHQTIPASLMRSQLLDSNTYTTYRNYYIYELFKK